MALSIQRSNAGFILGILPVAKDLSSVLYIRWLNIPWERKDFDRFSPKFMFDIIAVNVTSRYLFLVIIFLLISKWRRHIILKPSFSKFIVRSLGLEHQPPYNQSSTSTAELSLLMCLARVSDSGVNDNGKDKRKKNCQKKK